MPRNLDDALAWLAAARPEMERLLATLVDRNSFTRNPEGVAGVVGMLEETLSWLGLETERIDGGAFGPHLAFRNAVRGAPVLLVGHTDTVFPPGAFEAYRSEGARAFGPGVLDMTGGIAVLMFALAAGQRTGVLADVAIAGMLVSDEEAGSPSSQPILRERARGARCALVFESGRDGDLVVTQRKGVAAIRAVAHGVAAHAGNAPERGRSAIWALARFVERAQALADPARGLFVNVGTFAGGTSKNTVPARAEAAGALGGGVLRGEHGGGGGALERIAPGARGDLDPRAGERGVARGRPRTTRTGGPPRTRRARGRCSSRCPPRTCRR